MSKPEIVVSGKMSQAHAGTSIIRLTVLRRLIQLAMIGVLGQWSFYGIFRCPFLVPYISCQNCPVITCHGRIVAMFWGLWLFLPVSALLFGRAFCGWVCPGGLVSQMFGRLAPLKFRVKNAFTRFTPFGQYLGLAVALYLFYPLGQPRADIPIRIGEFFRSVALTFEHAGLVWLLRSFFVLGFLALGLIAANAWCRFACPTGSLLEALRHVSFFRFYKTSRCNDCNQCLKACEMGTRPDEMNCTNCGDCMTACPTHVIRFGRKKPS